MKLKTSKLVHPAALLLMVLAVPGCGMKGCSNDNSSGLTATDLPEPTLGEAVVRGTIKLDGEAPTLEPVHEPDSQCPHPVPNETVVVGEDGGLQNVVVYLDGVPASTGKSQPAAQLKQIDCQFVPHVLAVQVGQPLEISNSDAMTHNVHYTTGRNGSANHSFDGSDRRTTVSFARAEPEPFRVRCDLHTWMGAYVGVFEHPHFAVTDAAGGFEIANVPAGEYTLKSWHELYGEREQAVTVAEGGEVAVDLVYSKDG